MNWDESILNQSWKTELHDPKQSSAMALFQGKQLLPWTVRARLTTSDQEIAQICHTWGQGPGIRAAVWTLNDFNPPSSVYKKLQTVDASPFTIPSLHWASSCWQASKAAPEAALPSLADLPICSERWWFDDDPLNHMQSKCWRYLETVRKTIPSQ